MEYTATQLNDMGMGWANNTTSGDVVNGYRVINTGRGTRILEPASGGGNSGGVNSADSFLQSLKDELTKQFDELAKRTKEFDTNNPFVFDEALAKASAEERFNPYYEAELQDFTQGIDRQKQSQEGSMKLLTDLNRIQVGQDKRNLDEAISAAEEGYAGAGLFNSGAKERATGQTMISGQDTANTRSLNYNESLAGGNRQIGDINQNLNTGLRNLNAAKTTDITTEIEKQKAEEEARHATERLQYLGPEYTSGITGGINQLITQTWG
jgi:hypothetical protein